MTSCVEDGAREALIGVDRGAQFRQLDVLVRRMRHVDGARTEEEMIIDARAYHTIKEVKNGQGCPVSTVPGRERSRPMGSRHDVAGGSIGRTTEKTEPCPGVDLHDRSPPA